MAPWMWITMASILTPAGVAITIVVLEERRRRREASRFTKNAAAFVQQWSEEESPMFRHFEKEED